MVASIKITLTDAEALWGTIIPLSVVVGFFGCRWIVRRCRAACKSRADKKRESAERKKLNDAEAAAHKENRRRNALPGDWWKLYTTLTSLYYYEASVKAVTAFCEQISPPPLPAEGAEILINQCSNSSGTNSNTARIRIVSKSIIPFVMEHTFQEEDESVDDRPKMKWEYSDRWRRWRRTKMAASRSGDIV